MDASSVHRLAADALSGAGLEHVHRSVWRSASDELLWSVRLDRGVSYTPWAAEFSAAVRAWPEDDEHLRQYYALHGHAVPPSAAAYRWNEHGSYFAAAFDHRSDGLPESERATAFGFMAEDLRSLFSTVTTLDALAAAVRHGELGGFVHRRLREVAGG